MKQKQAQSTIFEIETQKIKQKYTKKQCQTCNIKFGLFSREHHCKRCFKSLCSNQECHKICQNCENDSSYIENLIQQLKLQWSFNSETGLKWVQYLNKLNFQIPTDNQEIQNITNELMKISKNIKDEEFLNQCSYQTKNNLYDDPNFPFLEQTNYSYHELLYQVTNEEPIQQIKKDVTDIINFFTGAQYIVWKKQQVQDLQPDYLQNHQISNYNDKLQKKQLKKYKQNYILLFNLEEPIIQSNLEKFLNSFSSQVLSTYCLQWTNTETGLYLFNLIISYQIVNNQKQLDSLDYFQNLSRCLLVLINCNLDCIQDPDFDNLIEKYQMNNDTSIQKIFIDNTIKEKFKNQFNQVFNLQHANQNLSMSIKVQKQEEKSEMLQLNEELFKAQEENENLNQEYLNLVQQIQNLKQELILPENKIGMQSQKSIKKSQNIDSDDCQIQDKALNIETQIQQKIQNKQSQSEKNVTQYRDQGYFEMKEFLDIETVNQEIKYYKEKIEEKQIKVKELEIEQKQEDNLYILQSLEQKQSKNQSQTLDQILNQLIQENEDLLQQYSSVAQNSLMQMQNFEIQNLQEEIKKQENTLKQQFQQQNQLIIKINEKDEILQKFKNKEFGINSNQKSIIRSLEKQRLRKSYSTQDFNYGNQQSLCSQIKTKDKIINSLKEQIIKLEGEKESLFIQNIHQQQKINSSKNGKYIQMLQDDIQKIKILLESQNYKSNKIFNSNYQDQNDK